VMEQPDSAGFLIVDEAHLQPPSTAGAPGSLVAAPARTRHPPRRPRPHSGRPQGRPRRPGISVLPLRAHAGKRLRCSTGRQG
jgi:hypothetical protein